MKPVPRSLLFTPGSRPDRFARAFSSGSAGVILDLEDAVAPGDKDMARTRVKEFMASAERGAGALVVRINPVTSVAGLLDLAMIAAGGDQVDFVLVPKVEGPGQLGLVAQVLASAGSSAQVGALVESALGVAMAGQLAERDSCPAFLMFGEADYSADLGQEVGACRFDFARATVVNAAVACGAVAIDSPSFGINDPDRLAEDCRAARDLGFVGKAAIHPAQVATIADCFAPSAEALARARRILQAGVEGACTIDGKMVDVAMVRWARQISG